MDSDSPSPETHLLFGHALPTAERARGFYSSDSVHAGRIKAGSLPLQDGFPAGGSCCRALLLRPISANTRQEQKIMNISDKVKMEFEDAIRSAIKDWQRDADEPANLFPRNRKLDKMTMIKLLCLIGGNSLRKEL